MDAKADTELEALANEAQARFNASRPPVPAEPGLGPKKLRYTHEAMVDLIIQNPGISQNHLAAAFGYTPAWVSTIIASDAFQEKLAARRNEVVDPYIRATIEERFRGLVIQSLEVLKRKLEGPTVSDNVALRAAELGAKALGIGGNAPPPGPSPESLDKLAERLLLLQRSVRERTINGEAAEVPSAG